MYIDPIYFPMIYLAMGFLLAETGAAINHRNGTPITNLSYWIVVVAWIIVILIVLIGTNKKQ